MAGGIAVVLASGGMDSCVTAAIAARSTTSRCSISTTGSGRKTENSGRSTRLPTITVPCTASSFPWNTLPKIGGSSLTDAGIPVSRADLQAKGIPTSYVPFRNANLLSVAVSWAEVLGARAIFVGAVEEDSSGYPDCRRSFYDAFEGVIREGTKPSTKLAIVTPLISCTKADIVRKAWTSARRST